MAKETGAQAVVLHKCEGCGQTLPVNDRGMPATSLYLNGHWLCPNCKYDPEQRSKFT